MPVVKSRKPRHLVAGVTALALASAAAVALLPGTAAAQVTPRHENFSAPFEFSGSNPCSGEDVELNGRFSGTVTEVIHLSGRVLFNAHQLLTAQGQGALGNHYTVFDTLNTSVTFDTDSAPFVLTQILVDQVIAQGDAPDFVLHTTNHMTIRGYR